MEQNIKATSVADQISSYLGEYANLSWQTLGNLIKENENLQNIIYEFKKFLQDCKEFFEGAIDCFVELYENLKTNCADLFNKASAYFWQQLPIIEQKLANFAKAFNELGKYKDEFSQVVSEAIDGIFTGCKMLKNVLSIINANDIIGNGVQFATNTLEFIGICGNALADITDLLGKIGEVFSEADLNLNFLSGFGSVFAGKPLVSMPEIAGKDPIANNLESNKNAIVPYIHKY